MVRQALAEADRHITAAAAEEHTELRDAMQAPLEKAESVEVTLQESAAARDEALEAADD